MCIPRHGFFKKKKESRRQEDFCTSFGNSIYLESILLGENVEVCTKNRQIFQCIAYNLRKCNSHPPYKT